MVPDRLPVQIHRETTPDSHWRRQISDSVPRELAEAAWEGYDAEGHGGQSCELLHERGGFSLGELGYYLARAIDEGRAEVRRIA